MSRASDGACDHGDAEGSTADSAGVPWAGRSFEPNTRAADDGSADPALLDALLRFRAGTASQAEVVDAFRPARVLVPLVAEKGDEGIGPTGLKVDKTQELSIVTVAAPDGRRVMPVFSSVEAMGAWHAEARPIPVPGPQAALAAAQEQTDLIIVDPGSPAQELGVRRTQLQAMALGERRLPAWADPRVLEAAVVAPCSVESRQRLLAPGTIVITTGQQPGLFTGPLYTVYKALSAVALARHLEKVWKAPVVPVFWCATDDHDYSEASEAAWPSLDGQVREVRLEPRPADAPLTPMYRLPMGPEVADALKQLAADLPGDGFAAETLAWLEKYLSGYKGAVLIVSHDRYFLDRVVSVVYELSRHRSRRFAGNYGMPARYLSPAAAARMRSYDWPGNIRELQNMMERAVILCRDEQVGPDLLAFGRAETPRAEALAGTAMSLDQLERLHIEKVLGISESLESAARQG